MDFWSGVVAEVKEEVRDAGEGGAFFEEVVLSFDFGGPFIICDGQLGPFQELECALDGCTCQLPRATRRADMERCVPRVPGFAAWL